MPYENYDKNLTKVLRKDMFNLVIVKNEEELLQKMRNNDYSIIMYDTNIFENYEISVYDILSYKKNSYIIPMIDLDDTFSLSECLNLGIDDYIIRGMPYSAINSKLLSVNRFLNKMNQKLNEHILTASDMKLDLTNRIFEKNGIEISLTNREFNILEILLRNKNEIVTREKILKDVWHVEDEDKSNVVEVYVNSIRKKINEIGKKNDIKTVRGVGYTIKDDQYDR